jgi:hypothetical protein
LGVAKLAAAAMPAARPTIAIRWSLVVPFMILVLLLEAR